MGPVRRPDRDSPERTVLLPGAATAGVRSAPLTDRTACRPGSPAGPHTHPARRAAPLALPPRPYPALNPRPLRWRLDLPDDRSARGLGLGPPLAPAGRRSDAGRKGPPSGGPGEPSGAREG